MKRGFDSSKYVKAQTKAILKRVRRFKRLYLEFGGKLTHDGHASRVLPGYKKTLKVDILRKLKNLEIIYCISAKDLQSNKVLTLKQRTYEQQALKDLREIKRFKLKNGVVVITRFSGESKAKAFAKTLEKLGKAVYFHKETQGYLKSASNAINSYKTQSYIPIKSNLIVVSGPAGGSGKMAVALSQIYHEAQQDEKRVSGFAKFETFPIWNLPKEHEINLAYEAATADLQDVVLPDKLHEKAYGVKAVNYNRDIKNFSILQAISRRITHEKNPYGYKSPTDMGVSSTKIGIINDTICRKAAIKEIKRRYEEYNNWRRKRQVSKATIKRMKEIMKKIMK